MLRLATILTTALALVSCGPHKADNAKDDPQAGSAAPRTLTSDQNLAPVDLADNFPSKIQVERLQQGLGAAAGPVPRALSNPTMLLIKHFEGWSAGTYDDSAGYCTIGWGHLIALKRCRTLSQAELGTFSHPLTVAEGEALLEQDTRAARTGVLRLVSRHLNDDEFGALSTFVFNLGEGNFAGSTLRAMVNRGENQGAAKQFVRWTRAGGVVQQGLVIRRKCEATLYVGQLRLDAQGRFTRAGCGALGAAAVSGSNTIDIDNGEDR